MDDVMNFFDDRIDSQDVVEVAEDGNETLKRLSGLIVAQLRVEDEIAQLEAAVADKNKELERLRTNLVPELMNELGMKKLVTADGATVELKHIVNAAVPKDEDRREKSFAWLRSIKADDLIKNEVIVQFGRGEDEKANDLTTKIRTEFGYDIQRKISVSPQSLSALVRRLREEGKDVCDALSLYEADISAIKRANAKAKTNGKKKK